MKITILQDIYRKRHSRRWKKRLKIYAFILLILLIAIIVVA
jgi:hypothetical protein